MSGMSVTGLWRFPVKSMQGEPLTSALVTERGVLGDRAYALVDAEDGKIASAKNPRKWGRLLQCSAAFVRPPTVEDPAPPVQVTLPDGATVRSDDPDVDAVLSAALGRPVSLETTAPATRVFEESWPPDVGELAPPALVSALAVEGDPGDDTITDMPAGMEAPEGTFFDLATLHVLTTASLDEVSRLAPGSAVDVRRYRPNIVLTADDNSPFAENAWMGRELRIGDAVIRVSIATMRCVMTTLPTGDLPQDRAPLRAIAQHNRVDLPGYGGEWACLGAYASVVGGGSLALGETAEVLG